MPYNGTGSFSPEPTAYPAVAGTVIEAAKYNALIADIASGLSTALTRDGQGAASADLSMGGFRLRNLANPSLDADAANLGTVKAQVGNLSLKGTDVTAATTTDLSLTTTLFCDVIGGTTITSFGTAGPGVWKILRFTGTPTIVHDVTKIILPAGKNLLLGANDILIVMSLGSGLWIVASYQPAFHVPRNWHFSFAVQNTSTNGAIGPGLTKNGVAFTEIYENRGSTANTGTGQFTAPLTGIYAFDYRLQIQGTPGALATPRVDSYIKENGLNIEWLTNSVYLNSDVLRPTQTLAHSFTISLNAGAVLSLSLVNNTDVNIYIARAHWAGRYISG
jgi:hypothetical protein